MPPADTATTTTTPPKTPQTPKDVNDLAQHGITPEQLVATSDPDMVVIHTTAQERLRLAGEHLDALRRLAVQVLADPDRASQTAALRRVLLGTSGTWTAHAYLLLRDDVDLTLAAIHHVRGLGGAVDDVRSRLAQRASRQQRHLRDADEQAAKDSAVPRPLGDAFKGCPGLDPRMRMPAGFEATPTGIWRNVQGRGGIEQHHILMTPATVISTPIDIDGGDIYATIVWRRANAGPDAGTRWDQRQVPMRTVCDGMRLLDLVAQGLHTDGIMAKQVSRYLMLSVATNDAVLPTPPSSTRCGWLAAPQDDVPIAFLYGDTVLAPKGVKPPAAGWPQQLVLPGLDQLRDALRPRGSAREWCRLVLDVARQFPLAMLPVYAACAAPLCHLVERPGFVLHLSGDSTGGKTSALRLGASAAGHPGEGNGLLAGWNASRVGVEGRASYLHHLPLFLDETTRNPDRKEVARIVFDVCAGHGRIRGATLGVRKLVLWHLPLISSGNYPLASVTTDTGLRARILDVPGAPLGDDQAVAEALAARIETATLRHHGHAIPTIVAHLQKYKPSHWASRYHQIATSLRSPSAKPVEARLKLNVALLTLAAELLQGYITAALRTDCDLEAHRSIDLLLCAANESASADPAAAALALAYDWATANQSRFWGRHELLNAGGPLAEAIQPAAGWAGAWNPENDWPAIAFLEGPLSTLLAQHSHSLPERLSSWKQRRWLVTDGKHSKRLTYIDGNRARCIVFSKDAIAAATGIDFAHPSTPSSPSP